MAKTSERCPNFAACKSEMCRSVELFAYYNWTAYSIKLPNGIQDLKMQRTSESNIYVWINDLCRSCIYIDSDYPNERKYKIIKTGVLRKTLLNVKTDQTNSAQ
jgi:hypothetical protein